MDETKNNLQKTGVDSDQLGTRYSGKAQNDIDGNQATEKQDHKPFPGRSSKAVAIKTYKDYAAESLKDGGGSLTKMIIAEREKKRETQRRSVSNPRNVALGVLSVIFIFLGLAVVVGAYLLVQNVQNDPRGQEILQPEPLVLFDYRSEGYIANPTRVRINRLIEEELANTSTEVGSIKYIFFSTDNQYGGKTLMRTVQFLEGIRVKASGTFLRSLDDNFMFGIYSTTENEPFLMLKTDNFDSSYAEILSWEQSMGNDLGTLLGRSDFDFTRSSFVDVVYFNKDARAVLDIEGNPVIGYSFIDRNTIVFFADRLTLREIINRSQENTIKQ